MDAGDLGSEPRILTASVRSEALAVTGNVVRALALGKQILAATAGVQLTDHAVREIRGRFLLLLLLSGKFREASVYLEETYSGAEPQTRLGGMFEIGHGVMDLHAGHLDDALSRLQAGRWQLRAQDPDALGGLAAAVCAYAAALQGEEETAGLLLDDLAQARPPAAWLVERLTRYFELSAQAELGQRATSIRALSAEAGNDAETSALAPALLFQSAAARLGDRQVGQKLGSLSGRVTGQFAALCSRLAEGMREADSEQLLAASKEAEACGNAVFARDAARKAVGCANDAGNRIALRIAQRAQQSLDDKFGSPKNGLRSLTTSTLTARECEVAVRAAAGTSNRKIAEQMHVSGPHGGGTPLPGVFEAARRQPIGTQRCHLDSGRQRQARLSPADCRRQPGRLFKTGRNWQEEPAMESLAETVRADRALGAGQGPGALPARRHPIRCAHRRRRGRGQDRRPQGRHPRTRAPPPPDSADRHSGPGQRSLRRPGAVLVPAS